MPYMCALVLLKNYAFYSLTFPTPLITPPDTSTYFMIAFGALVTVWGREGRNLDVAARYKKFVAARPLQVGHVKAGAGQRQSTQPSSHHCNRRLFSTSNIGEL